MKSMARWGCNLLSRGTKSKRMQAHAWRLSVRYPNILLPPLLFQDTNITLSQCKKMLEEGACIRHPSFVFLSYLETHRWLKCNCSGVGGGGRRKELRSKNLICVRLLVWCRSFRVLRLLASKQRHGTSRLSTVTRSEILNCCRVLIPFK
jgi:hypothetical protein